MDSCDYTMEKQEDDAENSIEPVSVPGVLELLEETILEDFETTEYAGEVVNSECEIMITADDAVAMIGDPNFEKDLCENFREENFQLSRITEEEDIDRAEYWQDNINPEPMSSLSMNTQADGADRSIENGTNTKGVVKEEETHLSEELTGTCVLNKDTHDFFQDKTWQQQIIDSVRNFGSQTPLSSNLSPSGVISTMSKHEQYLKTSISTEHEPVPLPRSESNQQFAVPSCSNAEEEMGQLEATDSYLLKEGTENQVAGESQKQHLDEREGSSCSNHEETNFLREIIQSGASSSQGHQRPFKCIQCGLTFKEKCKLNEHMWLHTKKRPHTCSQCGFSFTHKCNLTMHMRLHTGERPYKCSQCGKAFARHNNLARHIRVHTGERPFNCDRCESAFKTGYDLSIHKRIHTGEKPYQCTECGRPFAQKSHLTGHMRTHSRDRL